MQPTHNEIVARAFPGATLTHQQRLAGGVSADVYRLDIQLRDDSQRSVVLRAHGESHSGHGLALEFDLLTALYSAGIAVPKPLAKDDSCTCLAHPYLLIEFIEGSTKIPPDRTNQYIDHMADRLYQIHQAPVDSLPTLPERCDPLPELMDYLTAGTDWHPVRRFFQQIKDTTYAGKPKLLHGDFWPENLLWRNDRVIGILDWEDAALGDPLSDVAAACLELRYLFGPAGMARFSRAYAQHSPINERRLAVWQVYVAAAAQHFMGLWGLDAEREQRMRQHALASIRESYDKLKKTLLQ